MELLEITARTKKAIRLWAGLKPTPPIILDQALASLRQGAMRELNVRINQEFKGEHGFPIRAAEWDALTLNLVRDVRDTVKKRLTTQLKKK